ncbi:MAG TPA: MFS transporter [Candidatus Binataceae bacterium]|nr:MFS transporter [Candidatus Binataceae bacterium]
MQEPASPVEAAPEAAAPIAPVAPTVGTTGRLAAFRALRHRNFRLFFTGQLISLIGTWMQMVAQGWLVLRLSNSPFVLGLVAFANYLPILLVSLFAGVIVDHVDRRRLIVCAQTVMMLSAFVLATITWARVVEVKHVVMLAALNGLASSFDMPGRQAFLVEMVGREDLPNAIALNSMIFNGARALGPALAGMLLAAIGEAGCFFLNGLSFIAVIWSLLAMDIAPREAPKLGSMMWHRLREGLIYVWRHRPTFNLLLMIAIVSGFGFQYAVLMPVFARNLLHGGAQTYGFLLAAQGVGAVSGAIIMGSRPSSNKAHIQNLVAGLFGLSLAIIGFGASPWLWLSMTAQVICGAGLMSYMATTNTLLQLAVSDELRGRVMSMYVLSFIGFAPIGSLAVGSVGEHLSPRIAVMACGAISLLCGFYLLRVLDLFKPQALDRSRVTT